MKLIFGFLVMLSMVGCSAKKDDATDGSAASEVAQQVGDVMASIDEASGSTSGTLGYNIRSAEKTFVRLSPGEVVAPNSLTQMFLPGVQAASCSADTNGGFGNCTPSAPFTRVRTFNSCTIGGLTYNGSVTMTWVGSPLNTGCALAQSGVGNTITRVPNFTIQGRRGSTLTVTKSSTIGQQLTWTSGTSGAKVFTYANDGIRRVFTDSNNSQTFNFVTTATAMNLVGETRANRVLSGGSITVKDVLSSTTCVFTPTNVTWNNASCACPTSGNWAATCDDGAGHTSSNSLAITGCGTGSYTSGGTTESVTFDRCGS